MFSIQDQVLYGSHGACTIVAIENMRFGKTRGRYYVLQPNQHPDSRYYVPADKETAASKLRPLMTQQELLALLRSQQIRQPNWIPEESMRKLRYKELLGSMDRTALLNMIFCLHQYKKAQLDAGKKFHQCDDNFLHDAQRILASEIALVFGLEQGSARDFLLEQMNLQG